MIAAIFNRKGYTTISDLKAYPQYLLYNREDGSIAPIRSDIAAPQAPKYSFFKEYVSFHKQLFAMLKSR